MRLKATVRSFRHGLSDAERQETREAALEQLRRRHLWQQQQQRRLEGGITSSEESDENEGPHSPAPMLVAESREPID